jgi:hypothetical protein
VLDALEFSPAFVKTVTWDLVAWNRAGSAVFGFDALLPHERNLLRRIFTDPQARALQIDWLAVARFAVAAFRADTARAGAVAEVKALVDELQQLSPEFAELWRNNDVRHHGEGTKQLRNPEGGLLAFAYSAFSVDGRLVIYTPATRKDTNRIRALLKPKSKIKSSRRR